MRALTAYLIEGLDLAVGLANASSSYRKGAAITPVDSPDRLESTDATRLRTLQDSLREVLGTFDAGEASSKLNVLFEESAATPVLTSDDNGRWRFHLHSQRADEASRTIVKAAMGLATLIDDDEWGAIKLCTADRCEDFFIDRSRNRSRRFCSRTCANRINARNHRQRS